MLVYDSATLTQRYGKINNQEAPRFNDKVTVVMVTFNKYTYIKELIKSFADINYDRELIDIVVVDNASVDGTEEKLKQDFANQITLIQTGANLGGSGGFNTGMKYAIEKLDNDYIWLLDNDVVVHPDSLNWLLASIKNNEDEIAAVGSMVMQLDNPDYISELGAFMNWQSARVDMQSANQPFSSITDFDDREVEYCAACSLMKTRKSIEKIGYWEDLFIHFDDVDWCLRAQAHGLKIISNPKSLVFHESMHNKQPTWIKYYNVRNILYLYKNFRSQRLAFVLIKYSAWALYFMLHGFFANGFMVLKAIADFARDKKQKQDFSLENYVPMPKIDWKSFDEDAVFIFKNSKNLDMFTYETKIKPSKKASVILYSEKSLVQIFFMQLALLFDRRKVFFDGAFESQFMLPLFFKKKFVVYPNYRSAVDLT